MTKKIIPAFFTGNNKSFYWIKQQLINLFEISLPIRYDTTHTRQSDSFGNRWLETISESWSFSLHSTPLDLPPRNGEEQDGPGEMFRFVKVIE